jgi:molybdopterin-guanine dinucleotide biosynthesis protein A
VGEATTFTAAVLTGGRSRRMGRDKAFVTIDGEPMVRRVVRALRAAGAVEVVAVGGDEAGLLAEDLDRFLPDLHPGDGPLGGVLVALSAAPVSIVVVVACDMPDLTAAAVQAVVAALVADPSSVVAVAQPLCAAWRAALAVATLRPAFAAGERTLAAAIDLLPHVAVLVDPAALRNVNRPGDLTPPIDWKP